MGASILIYQPPCQGQKVLGLFLGVEFNAQEGAHADHDDEAQQDNGRSKFADGLERGKGAGIGGIDGRIKALHHGGAADQKADAHEYEGDHCDNQPFYDT
jgi:hypothetical protein